jgi:hypothetical protein
MAVDNTSAFDAADVAAKQLKRPVRQNLIQISGKSGSTGILPIEWNILFFEQTAEQSGVRARVVNNTMVEAREGYTQLDSARIFAYKREEIMEQNRLKIDSKGVYDILMKNPVIAQAKPTGLDMTLIKDGKYGDPIIWKITIYGKRVKDSKEVIYGNCVISAENGRVIYFKLNPEKLKE